MVAEEGDAVMLSGGGFRGGGGVEGGVGEADGEAVGVAAG